MQVICLEEEAFYALVEEVVERVIEKNNKKANDKWISDRQAMGLLGIKSKTTLQKLRDNGEIRFSQPEKKIIRYDRNSIEQYLERYVKRPFESAGLGNFMSHDDGYLAQKVLPRATKAQNPVSRNARTGSILVPGAEFQEVTNQNSQPPFCWST